MCISCAAVIHCNTQAGFPPPKILILDRTLTAVTKLGSWVAKLDCLGYKKILNYSLR